MPLMVDSPVQRSLQVGSFRARVQAQLRQHLGQAIVCCILASGVADTVTDCMVIAKYKERGDKEWAGLMFVLLFAGWMVGGYFTVVQTDGAEWRRRRTWAYLAALCGQSELFAGLLFLQSGDPKHRGVWIRLKSIRRLFEGLPMLLVQTYALVVSRYHESGAGPLTGSSFRVAILSLAFSVLSFTQGGCTALESAIGTGARFSDAPHRAHGACTNLGYVLVTVLRFALGALDVSVHVGLLSTLGAMYHLWVALLVLPHLAVGFISLTLFGRSDLFGVVALAPFASFAALRHVEGVGAGVGDPEDFQRRWPRGAVGFYVVNSGLLPGVLGTWLLYGPRFLGPGRHCDASSSVVCGVCGDQEALHTNCLSTSYRAVLVGCYCALVIVMFAYFELVRWLRVKGRQWP